jgi:uncharacterized protein YaeQ
VAIKATIFKAQLSVSDTDRGHYASHALTIARHPSETDERMMVRLVAFALNADEALEFGRGLSSEGEADLVQKDLTGAIRLWIDVGLPDERELRKACGRSHRVIAYLYGGKGVQLWWAQNGAALERCSNLSVVELPQEATRELAAWAARNMDVSCTIQDGRLWFASGERSFDFDPLTLKESVIPA